MTGLTAPEEPGTPFDIRHPDDEFVMREIEANRRAEFLLIPKAFLALGIVAALVVLRQLFFL